MELSDALKILRLLAYGKDPATNEPLAKEAPYNAAEVIRAINLVLEVFPRPKKTNEERQRENLARNLPRNAGLPWSSEEREQVAERSKRSEAIESIAAALERSRVSIIAELNRQGSSHWSKRNAWDLS